MLTWRNLYGVGHVTLQLHVRKSEAANFFLELLDAFEIHILFFLSFIRYINEDLSIVPMLKMIRDSGRATFLVTNR